MPFKYANFEIPHFEPPFWTHFLYHHFRGEHGDDGVQRGAQQFALDHNDAAAYCSPRESVWIQSLGTYEALISLETHF